MSKTGEWGNKIIVVLHSDGKRRHKKWCDNYSEKNYCDLLCRKCTGSAQCLHYKNDDEKGSDVRYLINPISNKPVGIVKDPKPGFVWCEYYRSASYGDKLLHNIILVKNTPYTFKICEVLEEDFYFFVVEYEGKKHKYSKKFAYRSRSVYIPIDFKSNEISEDL